MSRQRKSPKAKKVERMENGTFARTRELLCVDDLKIRRQAFREAEGVIRKLDQLEHKIQSFHQEDQKLFQEWENLTFRNEQARLAATKEEYDQLCQFHNRLLATARMLDIELYEAYPLLKDEQKAHAEGGAEERDAIEKRWAERDRYAEDEIEKQFRSEASYGGGLNHAEDEFDDRAEFSEDEKKMFDDVENMSDADIEQILRQSMGFFFLLTCFELGTNYGNFRPFLRLWNLANRSLRRKFAGFFKDMSGERIEDIIADLKERDQDLDRESSEDPSRDHENFEDEYVGSRHHSSPNLNLSQTESLKSIYRKLARKLHPDSSDVQTDSENWISQYWERMQKYYHGKDLPALEKLYTLTLLRLKDLSSLTLTEIRESQEWLNGDLQELRLASGDLKRSWAWGFSKRRDLQPLIKKVQKNYQSQLSHLVEQMSELKHYHAALEDYAQSMQNQRRTRSERRSSKRKTRSEINPW
jgi:hypothetical protein